MSVDDGRVAERLVELRAEYAKGEAMLSDLEFEIAELRAALLRLAGGIAVLEEFSESERLDDAR